MHMAIYDLSKRNIVLRLCRHFGAGLCRDLSARHSRVAVAARDIGKPVRFFPFPVGFRIADIENKPGVNIKF